MSSIFNVHAPGFEDDEFLGRVKYEHYIVDLPHQCDNWEITRTKNKEEAITEMKIFIALARGALIDLESKP